MTTCCLNATFVQNINPKGKAKVLEVRLWVWKVIKKTLKGTGDFASEEVIAFNQ